MKRRRSGISAILGTAIALVIVFTIFVPLFLYLQNLQAMFMQEASRRLQYELERTQERLEVYLSLRPSIGGDPNFRIIITLYNPGVVTVNVPTIYIESAREGIRDFHGLDIYLPQGMMIHYMPEFTIERENQEDIISVKVVTLRGNSFISKERLGPKNLPYYLVVILSNLTFGRKYTLQVETARSGDNLVFGCIQFNKDNVCKGGVSVDVTPKWYNDTEKLVFFWVSRGTYSVVLTEKESNSVQTSKIVTVHDDTVINLTLPRMVFRDEAPLKIHSLNRVLTVISDTTTVSIPISFSLSLEMMEEHLSEVRIRAMCIRGCSVAQPESKVYTNLYPGETRVDTFTVIPSGDGPVEAEYRIFVESAVGAISKKQYITGGAETGRTSGSPGTGSGEYEDRGLIRLCLIEKDGSQQRIKCPTSSQ